MLVSDLTGKLCEVLKLAIVKRTRGKTALNANLFHWECHKLATKQCIRKEQVQKWANRKRVKKYKSYVVKSKKKTEGIKTIWLKKGVTSEIIPEKDL